jgi:hypothetical protein
MEELSISPRLLETESVADIHEAHKDIAFASNKAQKQALERLATCAKELTFLEQSASSPVLRDQICRKHPKITTQTLRELMKHQLAGFYFLEHCAYAASEKPTGHVVLLRDIRLIPSRLGTYIPHGYSIPLDLKDEGHLEPGGFSMPVGVLRSPDIEHLLQAFAAQFTRIGIDDIDPAFQSELIQALLPTGDTP